MRVLTVRQPWATAIVDGRKTVENRSWVPTALAVGERFAIHAGVQTDRLGFDLLPEYVGRTPDLGQVVGTVLFAGTHLAGGTDCALRCGDDPLAFLPTPQVPTIWHWRLHDPIRFVTPFAARGALGLWRPDPTTLGRITTAETVQ